MNKLELAKLRKTKSIKESKGLYKYFIDPDGEKKDNMLGYKILMEYLLDGNYDLLNELININDNFIQDGNSLFYYILANTNNKKYSKELYKEINSKAEVIKLTYPINHIDDKNNRKSYFFTNLSEKVKNDKLKIFLLKQAYKYDSYNPGYLLGNYYKEKNEMDLAYNYYHNSAIKGKNASGMIMLEKYKDDNEKTLYYLEKLFDPYQKVIFLKYINYLVDVKGETKKAYQYLLANITLDSEYRYELARFYENGIYVKQNLLHAYLLYCSSNGIKDSNEKIEMLKPSLIEPFSKSIDRVLNVELKQDRIEREIEEKRQEKLRIEEQKKLEKEKEEKRLKDKYRNKLANIFKGVELLKDVLEPKDIKKYQNSKEYRKNYDDSVDYYDVALREESSKKRLNYIEKAAEKGHTYAMMALYELYKDIDYNKAIEYLIEAKSKNKDANEKYRQALIDRKQKIENIIKESKEDPSKLKDLIIKANQNDEYSLILLEECFGKGKQIKKILNVFDEEGQVNNLYANSFLYKYYSKVEENKDLCVVYLIRNCEANHFESIKELCKNHSYIAFKNASVQRIILQQSTIDFDIRIIQACILKTEDNITSSYNPNKAFSIFNTLESIHGTSKKIVNYYLGECYENGIGVDIDLEKALSYYKKYNECTVTTKIYELERKLNNIKNDELMDERKRNYDILMEEYNHDKYCEEKMVYRKEIENLYLTKDTKILEEELILRNQLLDLGYSADELYNFKGEFLGYQIQALEDRKSQEIIEKTRIANEKKIAEKLEKERQLLIQKEKIEKEKKIKTQIEKLEKERQLLIQKEKIEKEKKLTTSKTAPSSKENIKEVTNTNENIDKNIVSNKVTPTNTSDKTLEPISIDDPYYKDLFCIVRSTTSEYEAKRIARLRRKLDYPLEPHFMPKVDEYGKKHSFRSREKQYLADKEARKLKLIEYEERLYSLENPIKKDYDAYRRKVWHITSNLPNLTGKKFVEKCEETYNSRFENDYFKERNMISIKLGDFKLTNRDGVGIGVLLAVEMMLCSCPITVSELTLEIRGYIEYEKTFKYTHYDSEGNIYNKNPDSVNRDRRYKAQRVKEAEIKKCIINIFDNCNLFIRRSPKSDSGKEQYFEGLVKKLKFEFHWKYD